MTSDLAGDLAATLHQQPEDADDLEEAGGVAEMPRTQLQEPSGQDLL